MTRYIALILPLLLSACACTDTNEWRYPQGHADSSVEFFLDCLVIKQGEDTAGPDKVIVWVERTNLKEAYESGRRVFMNEYLHWPDGFKPGEISISSSNIYSTGRSGLTLHKASENKKYLIQESVVTFSNQPHRYSCEQNGLVAKSVIVGDFDENAENQTVGIEFQRNAQALPAD